MHTIAQDATCDHDVTCSDNKKRCARMDIHLHTASPAMFSTGVGTADRAAAHVYLQRSSTVVRRTTRAVYNHAIHVAGHWTHGCGCTTETVWHSCMLQYRATTMYAYAQPHRAAWTSSKYMQPLHGTYNGMPHIRTDRQSQLSHTCVRHRHTTSQEACAHTLSRDGSQGVCVHRVESV